MRSLEIPIVEFSVTTLPKYKPIYKMCFYYIINKLATCKFYTSFLHCNNKILISGAGFQVTNATCQISYHMIHIEYSSYRLYVYLTFFFQQWFAEQKRIFFMIHIPWKWPLHKPLKWPVYFIVVYFSYFFFIVLLFPLRVRAFACIKVPWRSILTRIRSTCI